MLEDFANVSCNPCVAANIVIQSLAKKFPEQLAIIKYSTNFPSSSDPFYLAASNMNDSKMKFYNILFAPTVIVDGTLKPVPTDSTDMIAKIKGRLKENPPFKIEISDNKIGNKYNVQTKVSLVDESFDYANCKLLVVVVEEEISFSNPPGSNGETVFYHVMRDILPESDGLSLIFDNKVMNKNFEIEINNNWNSDQISSIAFIQNIVTKEVYQANKSK